MSSQRGNVKRQRPQKHQNRTAFKNNMHDTSNKIKIINSIQPTGCCNKCKEIIEWRIKYKKYKLLSQPKKCVKCEQKTIKKSYSSVCDACAKEKGICVKCGADKEIAVPHGLSVAEEASQRSQLDNELKLLKERQRRTFHRLQESGKLAEIHDEGAAAKETNEAGETSDTESCHSNEDSLSDNSCEDSEGDDEQEPGVTTQRLDKSLPESQMQNLSLDTKDDSAACSSSSKPTVTFNCP